MEVAITLYKYSGNLLFFKIKEKCKECDITEAIIKDMMKREFNGKNVKLEIKPWLNNFFYCFFRFSWHAPLIIVNGKKFHQYSHDNPLFNRKELKSLVLNELNRK